VGFMGVRRVAGIVGRMKKSVHNVKPGQIMQPARRRRRVVALAVVSTLLVSFLVGYVLVVRVARVRILDPIQQLSEKLERPILVGDIVVTPTGARIEALRLSGGEHDVVDIRTVEVTFDPIDVLCGSRMPESVTLVGVRAHLPFPPQPGQLVPALASLFERPGKEADSVGTAGGEAPATALPRFELDGLELTMSGPRGQVVAQVAVESASASADEREPSLVRLEANGRFKEGLGRLSGAPWRFEAQYERGPDRSWAAALNLERAVSFPTDALPTDALSRYGYDRVALQAVEADSDGKLRVIGVRLVPKAEADGPTAPGVKLGQVEAELPLGIGLAVPSAEELLQGLEEGEVVVRDLHVGFPAVGAVLDVDEASVVFGPGEARHGIPAIARFDIVRPRLLLNGQLLAPVARVLSDPLLLVGMLRGSGSEGASDAESAGAPGIGVKEQAKALAGWLGDAELSVVAGRLTLRPIPQLPALELDAMELFIESGRGGPREASGSFRWRPQGSEPFHVAVEGTVSRSGWPAPHLLRLEGAWLAPLGSLLPDFVRLAPDAGGLLLVDLSSSPRESGLMPEDDVEHVGDVALVGRVELQGVGFEHVKIARIPVADIQASSDFGILWRPSSRQARLRLKGLSGGHAHADVDVTIDRIGPEPAVKLAVQLPEQPCDDVLRDIPSALVPRLQGARLEGNLSFDLTADVDFANPDAFRFDLDGDWSTCHALSLGDVIDVERLNGRFTQRIWEGSEPTDIRVGPGTPGYVSMDALPDYVWQAAIATEDMAFFKHQGFRTTLMTRAIRLNLKRGRYVYGGSTISQQLVKNLFLSREKTLSRKLEEAFITWHMERTLSKRRILELYLNCIEYGPGIYGIRKAAYTYFGVHPSRLTPLEAAFIMGLKPDPKSGYNVYRRRVVRSWWLSKLEHILRRLWHDMGVLTEAQFREAAPYVPIFFYPGEGRVVPKATGIDESKLGPPPNIPPMPPRSEGKHR